MNQMILKLKSSLVLAFVYCAVLLSFFPGVALAQHSDSQLRGHIRSIWKISRKEASDQKLNTLLRSNYPGTSVPWRSIVSAVYTTNVIVEEAKRKPTSSLISLAVELGRDQLIDKSLKNVEPPELKILRTAATGLYSSLSDLSKAAERTKLSGQLDRYFRARDLRLTKDQIINEQTNGKVDIEYNGGWIDSVGDSNSLISKLNPPTRVEPRQAWEIGEFLWDLKRNPNSFALEKQKIGDNLRKQLASGGVRISAPKTRRIALIVGTVIMIQPLTGGAMRPATGAETRSYYDRSYIVPVASPNGQYRVEKVGVDSGETLRVVRVRDRKQVFLVSASDPMRRVFFDGWLPDSRHIALWNFSHISGADSQSRYVINIETGRISRFNGWMAPNGKAALVVGKEGKAEETQGSRGEGPPAWYRSTPVALYTASTSSNLNKYNLVSARRKNLMLNGKPFAGLDKMGGLLLYPGFWSHDLLINPRTVEFSSDNRWALVRSHYYQRHSEQKRNISFPANYIVDMITGKVRVLRGSHAKFI